MHEIEREIRLIGRNRRIDQVLGKSESGADPDETGHGCPLELDQRVCLCTWMRHCADTAVPTGLCGVRALTGPEPSSPRCASMRTSALGTVEARAGLRTMGLPPLGFPAHDLSCDGHLRLRRLRESLHL